MPAIIVQPLDEHTLLSQSASGTSAASPSVTMSWVGQSSTATGEEDQPPGYTQARAPTRMLEYTFSSYGASTLLIAPPADAPDTRPLYRISSSTNVLNPSSGTTVIHRGGSVSQPLIGEFEWGLSCAAHTVTFNVMQIEINEVLKPLPFTNVRQKGPHTEYIWMWNNDKAHRLYWHLKEHVATSYLVPPGATLWRPHPAHDKSLAVFVGRPLRARADRRPHPSSTLTVYPCAHEGALLDHIVLSALILKRRRLAPAPWLGPQPSGGPQMHWM